MVKTPEGTLTIGSRGSQLALWQANHVRDALIAAHPGLKVEIEVIKTTGDIVLDVPLARIGGRGLFTKELDSAILNGTADLAVHSLKDVTTEIPEGLRLAAVTHREDPRDVLICRPEHPGALDDLPPGARIGTSSLRRRAQLRGRRPDLEVLDLRGNLNTRLARLDSGDYDAIILAAAGVMRLGMADRISHFLEPLDWLPAVGQGALALVTRAGDERAISLVQPLADAETTAAVTAERAFLNRLEGGCQVPIGALAKVTGDSLVLDGLVSDFNGTRILREQVEGAAGEPAALGVHLAERLEQQGAVEILEEVRRTYGLPPAPPAP